MALHIGYERLRPSRSQRTGTPDAKARAAGLQPKALLRADWPRAASRSIRDHTARHPARSLDLRARQPLCLEWVLDQYKEKKPKDPTIREKFDTYRFADYKEKVIDLLMRVTTVSVETMNIVDAMREAQR